MSSSEKLSKQLQMAEASLSQRTEEFTLLQKELAQEICQRQQLEAQLKQYKASETDAKLKEAKLHEQAQLLRDIYNGTAHCIVIVDVLPDQEFNYVGWNAATEKLTGITSQFVAGKTPEAVFGEDFGSSVRANYQRCLETGSAITYEEYIPFQGEDKWWLTTLNPLKNEQGDIYRILLTTAEVTALKTVEAAQKETNLLLNSIIEAIPQLFFVKDLQGRHIALNANLAEFFGRPADEVLGKTDFELLPPEVAKEIWDKDREVINTGVHQTFEEDIQQGDRTSTYFTTKRPLYDETGQIAGLIGLAQDITERKQAELALALSEQRFRDVTEAAGEYIWELAADGQYTFVTEQAKTVKGYAPDELLGHTPFEFMPEEDVPIVEALVQQAAVDKKAFQLEHRDVLPSGDIVWETVSGVPILDEQGKITGFRGTGLSITQRKQAEQAQARLTAILDATSDFVGIADMQGRQLYMNKAGYHLFEIPPEESIIGQQISERVPESARSLTLEQGIPIAIRDGIWQGETAVVSLTGKEIPVSQVIIAHHGASGEPEYLSTIVRDITVQKKIEATLQQKAQDLEETLKELQQTQLQLVQNEKMSSLGQLVAGIAHEVNNPVSFIYGNVAPTQQYTQDLLGLIELYQQHYPTAHEEIQEEIEAIELDFIKQDLPETLSSMKTGANRIKEIVSSLRLFSRLDEADCKLVDIHDGIESSLIILDHRLKATEHRPKIQVVKQYGLLPLVECYAGQMNQVFMNIFLNAIDALETELEKKTTLSKTPQIKIHTEVRSDKVLISIADNGTGISPDVKQRIFDPFFTTKKVGKGTGMGMAISYQLITEKHNGQIECFSKEGIGTEFVIEIPLKLRIIKETEKKPGKARKLVDQPLKQLD
ncbi:MAG: PAS domain-containing protein [Cyanobacteria bacterium J06621_11]